MGDPVVFNRNSAERIAKVVRRVERDPQAGSGAQPRHQDTVFTPTQFVIASDSTPQGYDSYAIGYRMQYGCDVSTLPIVPDVGTLLDGSAEYVGDPQNGPVLDWVSYKWVGQYQDDVWGRPVLINVNRLFRGYVFRGEFVQAVQMPGMLHGFALAGGEDYYPWAPSVANNDNIDPETDKRMECGNGWCATGAGHLILDVTLDERIKLPQIDRFTPTDVEIGDKFFLTYKEKTINFTAVTPTAESVVKGLADAWTDSAEEVFAELKAVGGKSSLTLTSRDAGTGFTVTASTQNGGSNDTQLLVRSTVNANDDDARFNLATVRFLKNPNPKPGESSDYKIWFAIAEDCERLSAGAHAKVIWNQAKFRWELITVPPAPVDLSGAYGPATHRMLNTDGITQWSAEYGGSIVGTGGLLLLCHNGDDSLWAVQSNNTTDNLGHFKASDGTLISRFTSSAITAIAADADHVYTINTVFTVTKYDNERNSVWTYNTDVTALGLAVDADGNVYVSSDDAGKGVKVLDSSGALTLTINNASDVVTDIAVDADGNIYLAYESSTVGVRVFDSAGVELWTFTTNIPVRSIAVDAVSGNVAFVGDSAANNLWVTDSAGVELWKKNPRSAPAKVAFDSEGNVYECGIRTTLTDGQARITHTMSKYDPTGTRIWVYDHGVTSNNGGLVIDADDNIYIGGGYTPNKVHPAYVL